MIQLSHDGPVARLFLTAPEARNALAVRHWEALAQTLAQVADSGARLLVVSGAGSAFSAGADLTEFPKLQAPPPRGPASAWRCAARAGTRRPADRNDRLDRRPLLRRRGGARHGGDSAPASPAASFAITPAKMGIGYPQEDVAAPRSSWSLRLWRRGLLSTGSTHRRRHGRRIGLSRPVTDQPGCDALTETSSPATLAASRMLKSGIGPGRRGIASDEGPGQPARRAVRLARAEPERLSRRRASRP
jgi:hypothetical protein